MCMHTLMIKSRKITFHKVKDFLCKPSDHVPCSCCLKFFSVICVHLKYIFYGCINNVRDQELLQLIIKYLVIYLTAIYHFSLEHAWFQFSITRSVELFLFLCYSLHTKEPFTLQTELLSCKGIYTTILDNFLSLSLIKKTQCSHWLFSHDSP